ncbi:phosphatidylinositol-4-phosphate 5-kinase-like protein 1, partial [Plakobranchus ocellatus]
MISNYRRSRRKKVSSWHRLKRRLTRKGVVPVNKDHPRYHFLSCICEGIRAVSSEPNQGPKDALGPEDFSQVIRKKVNFKGKEFEFESYASSVFATIRRSVGIEEDVYVRAVAPSNLPYLEFISNSKSGQDFFLSNDMQCMFKSNRPRDVRFFLCLLEDYIKHFISYPHSLLVKYIGCYTIKFRGRPRKFFLVMQSIFFPSARIEDRFDVKGCTAGRYQK